MTSDVRWSLCVDDVCLFTVDGNPPMVGNWIEFYDHGSERPDRARWFAIEAWQHARVIKHVGDSRCSVLWFVEAVEVDGYGQFHFSGPRHDTHIDAWRAAAVAGRQAHGHGTPDTDLERAFSAWLTRRIQGSRRARKLRE